MPLVKRLVHVSSSKENLTHRYRSKESGPKIYLIYSMLKNRGIACLFNAPIFLCLGIYVGSLFESIFICASDRSPISPTPKPPLPPPHSIYVIHIIKNNFKNASPLGIFKRCIFSGFFYTTVCTVFSLAATQV
jgi:hypothetical protein